MRSSGGAGGGAGAARGTVPKGGKGAGYGVAKGKWMGKGNEQGQGAAAAAALAVICAYHPRDCVIVDVPELATARMPLSDCSAATTRIALLTTRGEVFCRGGTGNVEQCGGEGLAVAPVPWPAAAVRAGNHYFLALSRKGSVCSWGRGGDEEVDWVLGRRDCGGVPCEVKGLPEDDPVIMVETGFLFAIAVTRSRAVYGWGSNRGGVLALDGRPAEVPTPQRSAELSRRGLRRIACGRAFAVGEAGQELVYWGVCGPDFGPLARKPHWGPVPLRPRAGAVAFPLRSLAAGTLRTVAAADAAGQLWCAWDVEHCISPAGLPAAERVVRVACCCVGDWLTSLAVALTAEGRLWDCRESVPCRSIDATHGRPLGLLPRGGYMAFRIFLIPDCCGGKGRLRLFARIAMRLRVPSDPLLAVLTVLMVHGDFFTGPLDDPFGCPAAPQ
eukprot:TRINITY_DN18494_c0_g2_i1.p1 TRINITY_DN18494_c0_g2~~TRINITY_DN18494_c0_g2_i1.p1  ORF type:complete len:470 (+),score=68.18 TRINITY_DN18494_c0_g2_i1:85-1410(+)